MKKNFYSVLYLTLALLMCLIPSLGMLVFGESAAAANEILAERPQWNTPEGGLNRHVLNDVTDYLADRFALRQEMVTLWARLNSALLGSSTEDQVVLGRDGWLYYAPTLADYTGSSLEDAELESIARHLAAIRQEAESRGAQFLFTVAPNKNSLHPEAMPAAYPNRHEAGNMARLLPYLEAYGIPYVDLFDPAIPYYRTDSHWTAQGAAMAADRLLAAAGRESAYTQGGFRAGETQHLGDLYEMLYPAGKGAEPEVLYTGTLRFEHLNAARGGNALSIRTEGSGDGSLYCWRDSFGIALYPYLADAFHSAAFSRSTDYTLPEGDYDLVILEIVERNLPTLIQEDTP